MGIPCVTYILDMRCKTWSFHLYVSLSLSSELVPRALVSELAQYASPSRSVKVHASIIFGYPIDQFVNCDMNPEQKRELINENDYLLIWVWWVNSPRFSGSHPDCRGFFGDGGRSTR